MKAILSRRNKRSQQGWELRLDPLQRVVFTTEGLSNSGSGLAALDLVSRTALDTGVWIHVSAVWGRTANGSQRKEIYINGELDYTGGAEPTPTTNTLPLRIGSDSAGCCDFDGRQVAGQLQN